MDLNSVRRSVQNFGVWNTAYDLGLRSLHRVTLFKVLQGVSITEVDPSCLEIDRWKIHARLPLGSAAAALRPEPHV